MVLVAYLDYNIKHKEYVMDHNRCVLCTRCVRVCDEVEGAVFIDIDDDWHRFSAAVLAATGTSSLSLSEGLKVRLPTFRSAGGWSE